MMRIIFRFRSIFAVLFLLPALLLSACGTDTPTTVPAATTAPTTAPATAPTNTVGTTAPTAAATNTAGTTAAATATTAPAAAGGLTQIVKMPAQIAGGRPVAITVVGKPLDTNPDGVKLWNDQIARFQKLYPNVAVTGSEYAYDPATFLTLVAGKQVPTLFEVYMTDPAKMVDQQIATDITKYYDASNLSAVYNPNILSLTTKDKKVYGIPVGAYAMGIGYNKDMFKAAGIANPPTTWDELAKDAKMLTKRDQGVAGFSFINDGSNATGWQYTTIAYGFGTKQTDLIAPKGDGTFSASFNKGAPLDALKFIKDLRWTQDVLPRDNMDWAKNGQTLATEQTAMAVMAGDQLGWIKTTYPEVDINKFGFAPMPAGANGVSTSLIGGNVAMVSNSATDDQKEAAVYYKLWTTFDPAEVKTSLELGKASKTSTLGAPTLPLYVGDYEKAILAFQKPYTTMPTDNYKLFVDAVTAGKVQLQPEPTPAGQDYYAATGTAVSSILTDQSADPAAILDKAATTFQTTTLDHLKK